MTLLIVAGVMAAVGVMYVTSQKELAPEEDQGILFNIVKVPQTANLDYLEQTTGELNKVFDTVPEKEHVFLINGMGGDVRMAIAGILFKPWEERQRTQKQILESLQPKLGGIAGAPGDLVPAALAAGRGRRRAAGAVRGADHGRLSAAGAGAGGAAGGSHQERHVHLHRHGPEVPDAAGGAEDRSRQGQQPGRQDVGHRRLAGDAAGRQLRQPLQSVRPQLPGDPAGAARLPPDCRLADALPGAHQHRRAGAAVERRHGRASRCSPMR